MGVKQYVAVVQSSTGRRFMVFETGDAKYYFFMPIFDGCLSTCGFPVLKSRLQPDIKRALRHGWGNALIR
jgi:hypothetical protein